MFILCSRNSNNFQRKFIKYLCKFLFDLEFVPRGKSNLKSLFEKSKYFSYNYFLICSKLKNQNNKLLFNIYKIENDNYFIDKKYLISNINYNTKAINYNLFFNKIRNYVFEINDFKNIFYFLNEENKSKKSKYTYKLNSIDDIENKDNCNSNYNISFVYDDKELGFSFNLEEVIKC
jgi:hypothetical protein